MDEIKSTILSVRQHLRQLGEDGNILANAFSEAVAIVDTQFQMRFAFAALLLRELAERTWKVGELKDEILKTEGIVRWPWLEPDRRNFTKRRGSNEEILSARAKIKIALYGSNSPYDFANETNHTVDDEINSFLKLRDSLNSLVHNIANSFSLSHEEGRQSIAQGITILHTILSQRQRMRVKLVHLVNIPPGVVSMNVSFSGVYAPGLPGEILLENHMKPKGISANDLALKTGVNIRILNGIIEGTERITPEIASEFEKVFGLTADKWIKYQSNWDIWQPYLKTRGYL